jgi:hypothetical protein
MDHQCHSIESLNLVRSTSKIADHARGPGTGRFESAAHTAVGEHFERSATPPSGVRCIFEVDSINMLPSEQSAVKPGGDWGTMDRLKIVLTVRGGLDSNRPRKGE